jgi:serine/threonine protein kinase
MSDPNIGRVLAGKYDLVRLLGAGGMGAVYEGKNQIGKRVAVKLLRNSELVQDEKVTARFFREAQASAAVVSKHVVDVYDTGVDADTGAPFIIMAFLSGEDLEHVVERVGALNPVAAVRIVSQAAAGLAKAHEVGIVHRDIKPANLFLAEEESDITVKILDFGIAKVLAETATAGTEAIGTPLWMAPEQTQAGASIGPPTDVWALGLIAFRLLAGRVYWTSSQMEGASTFMLMREVLFEPLVAASARSAQIGGAPLPPSFDAWFARCVARDVAQRFPDAGAAFAALEQVLRGVDPAQRALTAPTPSTPLPIVPAGRSAVQTVAGAPIFGTAPGTAVTGPGLPVLLSTERRRSKSGGLVTGLALAGCAVALAAVLFMAQRKPPPEVAAATNSSSEETILADAEALADKDLEAARARLAELPAESPLRSNPRFKALEARCANRASTPRSAAAAAGTVLAELGPLTIGQGNAPDERRWLPDFQLRRDKGDENATVLAAYGACSTKGMALCTESQWTRACSMDPSIGAIETWTVTFSGASGFVVRGGSGGCTARRVVGGSETSAMRAGVCCDPVVAIRSENQNKTFLTTVSSRMTRYERGILKRSGAALAPSLDEQVTFLGKPYSRDALVSTYDAWFRRWPDQWTLYDTCDVTIQPGGEATWTADCATTAQKGGEVAFVTTRYVWSAEGKVVSIQEAKVHRRFAPP